MTLKAGKGFVHKNVHRCIISNTEKLEMGVGWGEEDPSIHLPWSGRRQERRGNIRKGQHGKKLQIQLWLKFSWEKKDQRTYAQVLTSWRVVSVTSPTFLLTLKCLYLNLFWASWWLSW